MKYLMNWKKDLINKFCLSTLLLMGVAGFSQADLSVTKPVEREIIYSVAESVHLNLDISQQDLSALFVNGREVPLTSSSLHCFVDLTGFGEKKIYFLAINAAGKVDQYVRTVNLYRTFPDIKNHWAKREIEALATLGYLDDYYGGVNYYPESPVSRVDLAKVLTRLRDVPVEKYSKNSIQDVLPGYWGLLYINAAVQNKLLGVDEKDNFYPQALVTRTELIAALVKDFTMPYYAGPDGFLVDLPEKFWARDAVYTAMKNGMLPPVWDLKKGFLPNYVISRAELAAIIARLPQVKEKINAIAPQGLSLESAFYETSEARKQSALLSKQAILEVSKSRISANNRDSFFLVFNAHQLKSTIRVKRVEADLTALGKLAHTVMFDDGEWGDKYSNDGLYTLEVVPAPNLEPGKKNIVVQVYDATGNVYDESVTLEILTVPTIQSRHEPDQPVVPVKRIVQTNTPVIPPPAPKPVVSPTVVKPPSNIRDNVYTVLPGDSLMVVAYKMTGTTNTWKDIAKYNNIKIIESTQNSKFAVNANIEIGQKIVVPRELLKKK